MRGSNRAIHRRMGAAAEAAEGRHEYDYRLVFRMMAFVKPDKGKVIVSVAAMFIFSGTVVAAPWLIERAIDSVVVHRDANGLRMAAILLAVNAVVGYFSNFIHLATMSRVGQNLLLRLRRATFDHLQRLSMSYYDRAEVGGIMSRVQNDVQQLQEFLSIFVLALSDLVVLVGIVVAMLLMNAELALITFSVVPVLLVMMVLWQRYALRIFMRVRREVAHVNSELQENISGIRVIQSLDRQDENLRQFDDANRRYVDTSMNATRLSAALNPSVELVSAVSTALVIIFGGLMVLDGNIEVVGVLVAFALYIQRFFDPIRSLTMQYGQLQRAVASGRHIFEILDTEPLIQDRPGAPPMPPLMGEVRYEGVSFHYIPGMPVLKDVNLVIRPGERVALAGPTGAGKTTLASLISRLYDVTDGRVLVDGHDVREVARTSLNHQVSVVSQEPFLFSGTIMDNIRFANPDASDEEVIQASRAVGAHGFIQQLEAGYDAQVEERGINFSPGQRQLISLARALVAQPKIVVLDEATASVDSKTELMVQNGLERVLEGRTSIIIAHRFSTIRRADRVVVMDQGSVVEQGSHQELLERKGLYARLYALNAQD